jgi:hypothetical protein
MGRLTDSNTATSFFPLPQRTFSPIKIGLDVFDGEDLQRSTNIIITVNRTFPIFQFDPRDVGCSLGS